MTTQVAVPGDRSQWNTNELNKLGEAVVELQGVANGGSLSPVVKYRLISDGTTVSAYDAAGTLVTSSTDGGAVLTACLPAANGTGWTIDFRNDGNVFPWGSVPALPKGITRDLILRGNGATIRLSAGGPRFLDFNKTADYDNFQNIELHDFTIDCNNIGGKHHVVIGTYVNAVQPTRLNVTNLLIDNIHTVNVPVDSTQTNHRLNIWIVPDMPVGSATCSMRNISVTRVKFEGGNMGIVIGGTGSAATNLTLYDIFVDNWWHSLLAVQTAAFSSSNCQIGSLCNVDRVTVSNGYGQYSGDVGVEIDSAQVSTIEKVVIEDAFNAGFYHTNFNAPPNPNEQINRFRDCRVRKLTQAIGVCDGYKSVISNSIALNIAQYANCEWYCSEATGLNGKAFSGVASVAYELRDCRFVRENWTGSASNAFLIYIAQAGGSTTRLKMDNVECLYTGTIGGAAAGKITCVYLDGGTFILDIDSCDLSINCATATNNTNFLMWLCPVNATAFRGKIARCKFANTVDAGLNCIFIDSLTTGFAAMPLFIERNDFSGLNGARELVITAATMKPNIRMRSNGWKTKPVPVALTGLVTATGKQIATMWPALAVFIQGSGVAVTAVDFSTNGETTYTNFLTQSSAALPAGFDQNLGPLTSDAYIKATFTTTQPTITLVPVDP